MLCRPEGVNIDFFFLKIILAYRSLAGGTLCIYIAFFSNAVFNPHRNHHDKSIYHFMDEETVIEKRLI